MAWLAIWYGSQPQLGTVPRRGCRGLVVQHEFRIGGPVVVFNAGSVAMLEQGVRGGWAVGHTPPATAAAQPRAHAQI